MEKKKTKFRTLRKITEEKPIKRKAPPKKKKTQVVVKYDCGMDNQLYLRGEGAGLSWHHGTPLKNTQADEWTFEVQLPEGDFEFKVLVNDQVFEVGDNHKAASGATLTVHPKFS